MFNLFSLLTDSLADGVLKKKTGTLDTSGFDAFDTSGIDMMSSRPPMIAAQTPATAAPMTQALMQTPSVPETSQNPLDKFKGGLGGKSRDFTAKYGQMYANAPDLPDPMQNIFGIMNQINSLGGGQREWVDEVDMLKFQPTGLRLF